MQQLTDALLDMESERSIWTAKEKEYLEANHRLNICLDENRKLSEDLIKVPLIGLHVLVPLMYTYTMSILPILALPGSIP
jgi:hypothetical protein